MTTNNNSTAVQTRPATRSRAPLSPLLSAVAAAAAAAAAAAVVVVLLLCIFAIPSPESLREHHQRSEAIRYTNNEHETFTIRARQMNFVDFSFFSVSWATAGSNSSSSTRESRYCTMYAPDQARPLACTHVRARTANIQQRPLASRVAAA